MPDGTNRKIESRWHGVGVHPTPLDLVNSFAEEVIRNVVSRLEPGNVVNLLDACAGDGRLGHAVASRLLQLGFEPRVTLVESYVQQATNFDRPLSYDCKIVSADFFSSILEEKYDVVVSNPPYLALSKKRADELQLDWGWVRFCGKNLYGMALVKCFEVCNPGGVVGFLGPYGWVRNRYSAELRERIRSESSCAVVRAFSSRRLFPNVHQDVAIQIFRRRLESDPLGEADVLIGYDGNLPAAVDFSDQVRKVVRANARVRVGPFVWNRERELISARSGIGVPVIYGGNISQRNIIVFDTPRYRSRQYLAKSRVPRAYLASGPCIVIKRSMRGDPGAWLLDLAVIADRNFEFVAENHVIVVSLAEAECGEKLESLAKQLRIEVERNHRDSGHANLSAALVNRVLERIESSGYMCGVSRRNP